MYRGHNFLCAFLMLGLLLCSFVSASPEKMTEADFRAMKIKDLRIFLEDRGLQCVGCQEKADFVRFAYQNREKKPSASSDTRKPPADKKLWEAWSENAKSVCHEEVQKRGNEPTASPFLEICDTIANGVDSFFMQHGKRIANRLKKIPDKMLKTSYKTVYYDAGYLYLRRLVGKCLVSPSSMQKCESLGNVMKLMEGSSTDFQMWLTNVGIENTNPMYEILQSGDL